MTNREIEIKIRAKDSEPLLRFLEENGSLKSEKHQRDEYFTPANRNFVKEEPVKEWLRLREEEGRCSLDYKNWHYADDGRAYHCDEYEVGLDNPVGLKNILRALDFESLIVVDKERRTFMFKDYEIALDCVEGLGDYVEVEYKGDENVSDTKKVAEEMREFVEKTGCQILEQDFVGYPYLLLEKKFGIPAK
ncbi:MAG: class IV adenylate cyclase [bacterium]